MLKENGKANLIKKAKSLARKLAQSKDKSELYLGSRVSPWCKELIGKKIDYKKASGWNDFGKPEQVIFGYPGIKGVYAKILKSSDSSFSSDATIFLFVGTEEGRIENISYSMMSISPMGKGADLMMEMSKQDSKICIDLINQLCCS